MMKVDCGFYDDRIYQSCRTDLQSYGVLLMEIVQTFDIRTKELYWTFKDTNGHIWYMKAHEIQPFLDVRHRILR